MEARLRGVADVRKKVVFMGAARVGKTSLINQFLYDRFSPKYKQTVEEMHQQIFSFSGASLILDILDTSGACEVSFHSNLLFSFPSSCRVYAKKNI